MIKFKGTQGKWDWYYDQYANCYEVTGDTIIVRTNDANTESKANALLISKAPEMLGMLEDIVNGDSPDLKDIAKLIKEATEI